MITHIHKFRQKMDAGQLCLGTAVTCSDPALTEALCDSVDFLFFDLEHSPTSLEALQAHLIAARAGGAPAVVRVPGAEVSWIKRVLDTGAEGILVPQITSVAEVCSVVAACRYPPLGNRGYGPRRPSNYGRNGGADYIRHANQHLFVAVQIETAAAVQDVDAILAVPGLDSVVVGPNDLAASLGYIGQLHHPEVLDTIQRVVGKARQAGLYVGMGMGPSEDYACLAAKTGVQWIQCGGDCSYLVAFADQLFGRIRQRLAE